MTEPTTDARVMVERDFGIFRFLNAILRRRRFVARAAGTGIVLAVAAGLLAPRTYSSRVTLSPLESGGSSSGLAGVAAQLGVRLPTGASGALTPDFYADLIISRAVLFPVIQQRYEVWVRRPWWRGGDSIQVAGTLSDLLDITEGTATARLLRSYGTLRNSMTVGTDAATGMVNYSVSMPSPALAKAVSARVLAEVTRFNVSTRQSQAAAERRFVGERLEEARAELTQAEARLQRFLQQNRMFATSPQLTFEHDRLQRDVALRQSVVASLTQGFEQARIGEVRDTPVFTVIESPDLPATGAPRRLVFKAILGATLGVVLALFVVFASAMARQTAALEPDASAELALLRAEVAAEWRARLARVRALAGRRRS